MVKLSPRVARVRAPNPSPMTLDGTNSYLIDCGAGQIAAIDPGPAIAVHIDALVAGARELGGTIAAIFVTHGHPDHFPAAAPLATITGAPVYAHTNARFPHTTSLAGECDVRVGAIELHTFDAPGHTFDHLVYILTDERALFTGDVIIGAGTVVIAPPGGAMRPYQATLERLRERYGDARAIYGGHGEAIADPRAKIDEYIAHRARREAELLAMLAAGAATIPQLVTTIYAAVGEHLWPAAARQMMAYLDALTSEGRVRARPLDRPATTAERAILEPDLARLATPDEIPLLRAELGLGESAAPIVEYALIA